eukprot:CAMPEP_0171685762 /NCGR_PEP_ID=MMETSP0991-20121206/2427_1 /TAXON_ID=483369 /ORGANISM="non described non described, Strain CCMP2098" /LENGTH=1177 /DNA_ID=CAMNT_0012273443 /DNA_START=280 /DNA_END=3812 /DNA_ORIENTATION=+
MKLDAAKPADERILSFDEYTTRKARSRRNKQSVQTILFIVLTAVMFIVEASVEIWTCDKFDDGSMRLPANPSTVCSWDDITYRPLLVASVAIVIIYIAGLTLFLVVIIESPTGRLSAAAYNVTHAKLLRDATIQSQITFFFTLVYHGREYGRAAEHRRIKARLYTRFKIALAVKRLHLHRMEKGVPDPDFERDLLIVKKKLIRFEKSRRPIPKPREEFFSSTFPVFVATKGDWIRGVFHGFDVEGHPRVATGSGHTLSCVSYQNARVSFEYGRPVKVRNDLSAWHQQDGDPLNAMAGAPLGVTGTVAVKERSNSDSNASVDAVASIVDFVDVELPSTTTFTFYLDLTEHMGFRFHRRWGKVLVAGVVPGGQGSIAGLTDKCNIHRVGDTAVNTQEEFEIAVVKRRIVSAQLRKKILEDGEEATPLNENDELLLANSDAVDLISPPEKNLLTKEIKAEIERGGLDTHCTVAFRDPSFTITRKLPTDFKEFHKIAELKPFDEYWSTFGSIISAYKSSSRHFEHWANIRKIAAVVAEVALASVGPVAQTTTMLSVCCVALFLQLRLSPYDDLNALNPSNSAGAILSNNSLEAILLVLQIAQLCVGLLSLFVPFPDIVIITLYLFNLFLGLAFSLIALSTSVARAAHAALQRCEPYIETLQQFLGVTLLHDRNNPEDDAAAAQSAKDRRLTHGTRQTRRISLTKSSTQQLLQAARVYEVANEVPTTEEEVVKGTSILERFSTRGSQNRQRALRQHQAERLEESEGEARARAQTVWAQRREAAKRRGSGFKTKADDVGHFASGTVASQRSLEYLQQDRADKIAKNKGNQLQSEKQAWEARRDKAKVANSGYGFSTEASAEGHFLTATVTSVARGSLLEKQRQNKSNAVQRERARSEADSKAWKERREATGGCGTVPEELGNLALGTTSSTSRVKALEDAQRHKNEEGGKAKAEREEWQRRQTRKRSNSVDSGVSSGSAFGRDTVSATHRKQAREAEESERLANSKLEAAGKKAQVDLWRRRMSKQRNPSRVNSVDSTHFSSSVTSTKRLSGETLVSEGSVRTKVKRTSSRYESGESLISEGSVRTKEKRTSSGSANSTSRSATNDSDTSSSVTGSTLTPNRSASIHNILETMNDRQGSADIEDNPEWTSSGECSDEPSTVLLVNEGTSVTAPLDKTHEVELV